MLDEFIHEPRIAYFSMEIALRSEMPTYAGGLGVLAGDTVRFTTNSNGWCCRCISMRIAAAGSG